MLKDLKHAARLLLQAKGWTIVVVLSLALGIGANVALFGWVNGLLLRQIVVRDPGTLVRLRAAGPNDMVRSSSEYGFVKSANGERVRTTFSYPMYRQFLASNTTMTDLLTCAPFGRMNVVVDGHAEIARSFISSGNYYNVLGISAALGRTLQPDDDRADAPTTAVVSYRYWRTRFGGETNIIGKVVRANNVPVIIVGVLPREFTGIQEPVAEAPDISFAMAAQRQFAVTNGESADEATYWWLQVMGRLKPGVTPQQVEANLGGVFQQTAKAGFDQYLASASETERTNSTNSNRTRVARLVAEPGARGIYDPQEEGVRAISILGAVVGLVLLIVCANVANLLLSRAAARQKEISIRLSVGATRARLIRQMLTESVLLSAIGAALGVVLAIWLQSVLRDNTPLGQPAPIDWRVVVFVAVITLLTGVGFGIAPALMASRADVSTTLKQHGRSLIGSRRLLSKSLLVAQVALSLVLLVGAALFLRTLHNLRDVNIGFDPSNLALFAINPQLSGYDQPRALALYGQVLERLRVLPGVRAVALSQPPLLSGSENTTSIYVQGRTYVRGQRDRDNQIYRVVVSPAFFETMAMPVAAGRAFSDRDVGTAPAVVMINEAAARRYFPGADPIGQRFGSTIEESGKLEIVGIVRDAKYNRLREDAPPTMYVPYQQNRTFGPTFEVRTAGDPGAVIGDIRETMRQIDPNLPLTNVSTQLEQIERRLLQERAFAQALSWFGLLALMLAAIGLFGLMSYGVARRTNEIGIRMALGAQRLNVLGLIMRESMILVGAGVAIGLTVAASTSRLINSLLFGLAPTDALSMLAAVGVMLIVAAIAGYLPARRASRVDPLVALRVE
jgi:predicted permease